MWLITLKRWIRQLLGKDLPKDVIEEVDGVGVSTSGQNLEGGGIPSRLHHQPVHVPATGEIVLIQQARQRWLPKPTTRRRHLSKRERIPARNVDLGKFMKGKGKGQHKFYRRSVGARIQPEDD